jgi:hypothetical protein
MPMFCQRRERSTSRVPRILSFSPLYFICARSGLSNPRSQAHQPPGFRETGIWRSPASESDKALPRTGDNTSGTYLEGQVPRDGLLEEKHSSSPMGQPPFLYATVFFPPVSSRPQALAKYGVPQNSHHNPFRIAARNAPSPQGLTFRPEPPTLLDELPSKSLSALSFVQHLPHPGQWIGYPNVQCAGNARGST